MATSPGADHVINASKEDPTNDNPLKNYFTSLSKVELLQTDLVLPAHLQIFNNLQQRVMEMRYHHENRLCELKTVIDGKPLNVYQVASRLSWSQP